MKHANGPSLCSDREQSYAHPSFLLKYNIKGGWSLSHKWFGVFETLRD